MRQKPVFLTLALLISAFAVSAQRDATRALPTLQGLGAGFDKIQVKEFISLESFEGSIAGVELTCEQSRDGKIGFCGGKCTDQVGDNAGASVSQKCAAFMNDYIPKCLEEIGCHDSAAFCGVGGHAKRTINKPGGGSKTPSRHSTGDAVDIFGMRCKDNNGQTIDMDFNSAARKNGPTRKRYDAFLACWRGQVDAYKMRTGVKAGGAISCEGSTPPNNHLHNDHLHLSCPVVRKNVAKI